MLSSGSSGVEEQKPEAKAKVEVALPATLISEMKTPELDTHLMRIETVADGRVVAFSETPSTAITFWDTEKKRCDAKIVMPIPIKAIKESPEGRLVVLDQSGYVHAMVPPRSDAPVLAFQPTQCCYNRACVVCSYIDNDNSLEALSTGDWVSTTLYGGVRVNSNACSEFSPTDPLPFHCVNLDTPGIKVCCSSYTMDHGRAGLCCYCCTRAGWNLGSIYALTDNRLVTFYNNGDLLVADLANHSFGNRQVCPGTPLQNRDYQVAVLAGDTFVRVIMGATPIQIYELDMQFNVVLKAEVQSAHPITALTALPSKTGFVIGDDHGHLQFWDLQTRRSLQTLDVSGGAVGRSISSVTTRKEDGAVIYASQAAAPDFASAMGIVSYDPEIEYVNYLHAIHCGAVLRDLKQEPASEVLVQASAGKPSDNKQVSLEPYFPVSIVDLICQKLAKGDYGRLFSTMYSKKPPARASLIPPSQSKMKR